MNAAELIVPRWYLNARSEGSTPESLRLRVANFFQDAVLRDGKRGQKAPPADIAPEFIEMVIASYEAALREARYAF